MMPVAEDDSWVGRRRRPQRAYLLGSLIIIVAYPFLPAAARIVDYLIVSIGLIPALYLGQGRIPPGSRRPWSLLLIAMAVINLGILVELGGDRLAATVGGLVNAVGNLIVLAAALALIVRRGRDDLGGIIDTTIIALAAGGLLWDIVLLPHLIAMHSSLATRANLFVVVFAMSGVLGALLRLAQTAGEPIPTLWLLMTSLLLAIGGTILLAENTDPQLIVAGRMTFMLVYTIIGLAALDPSAPLLARAATTTPQDRLTTRRLTFLGAAVAAIPVVTGTRALLGQVTSALLLTVNAVLVTTLVMVRVGLLSAERTRAERALEYEAAHDPLTGLPNRREFVGRLGRALTRGNSNVILFCDLNDFKAINDRLGHNAGDQILVEVGQRLRGCVRDTDVVSRFGGDEFLILLTHVRTADVDTVGQCISNAMASPIELPGARVRIGASIGIAAAAQQADPEELIRQADHAMYQAKRTEQNTTVQPTPATNRRQP
jgi:diguanylate cyclase